MQELQRDYAVTEEIYQDLLKRRESQQVVLDQDNNGAQPAFSLYEQARLPVSAMGPRFFHFALAGLVLGVLLPLLLLWLWLRLDPRIRLKNTLQEELGLPVVAVVPAMPTRRNRRWLNSWWVVGLLLLLVVLAYLYAAYLKLGLGV